MNVRQNASRRDGDVSEQFIELLVVPDGELNVARHDSLLLVVTRGVARELENLSRKILEHGAEVDGRTSSDACRVTAVSQVAVDTTHWELESGASASAL